MKVSSSLLLIVLLTFSIGHSDSIYLSNGKTIKANLIGIDEVNGNLLVEIDRDSLKSFNFIEVNEIRNPNGFILYQSKSYSNELLLSYGFYGLVIYTLFDMIFDIMETFYHNY